MPVDMSRYPKNWEEIRREVLIRAGGDEADPRLGAKCENCGVENYAVGYRDKDGQFVDIEEQYGTEYYDRNSSYIEARTEADSMNADPKGNRYIVIVLTIAHVHDPDPMNVSPDNLAAWCQACHNRHDVQMRQRNAKGTKRRKKIEAGQLEMKL